MAHSEIVGFLKTFDPHGLFEIDRHVKPELEYITETFTCGDATVEVEFPFDLLIEVLSGEASDRDVSETPKGTSFSVYRGELRLKVAKEEIIAHFKIGKGTLYFFYINLGGNSFSSSESMYDSYPYDFEPKIGKVTFVEDGSGPSKVQEKTGS